MDQLLTDHQPPFGDSQGSSQQDKTAAAAAAAASCNSKIPRLLSECKTQLQTFEEILCSQEENPSRKDWDALILLQSAIAELFGMVMKESEVSPQDLLLLRDFLEGLYQSPGKESAYEVLESLSAAAQETQAATAADDQPMTQTDDVGQASEEEDCGQRPEEMTQKEYFPPAKRQKTCPTTKEDDDDF